MIKNIFNQLFSKELPKWFRLLNLAILLPILLFPLVFYTTIFFFDNPKNLRLTYLLFFAVNVYPIYLVVIAYFNCILFKKNKIIGSILPTLILMILIFGVIYITLEISVNISESVKKNNERTKQGYIGVNDDFKIINNNVYRYDTIIKDADAKTFEIVSWNWQRDKNYYYYIGKRIEYIDRNTFEDLDYHYGKDRLNVYYDEKIIEGADAKTFTHIDGTQDGKDKNACYRRGEKVECKVLLKEE